MLHALCSVSRSVSSPPHMVFSAVSPSCPAAACPAQRFAPIQADSERQRKDGEMQRKHREMQRKHSERQRKHNERTGHSRFTGCRLCRFAAPSVPTQVMCDVPSISAAATAACPAHVRPQLAAHNPRPSQRAQPPAASTHNHRPSAQPPAASTHTKPRRSLAKELFAVAAAIRDGFQLLESSLRQL